MYIVLNSIIKVASFISACILNLSRGQSENYTYFDIVLKLQMHTMTKIYTLEVGPL